MDKKLLLEALQKDLEATKKAHQLLTEQIQNEEESYWSQGVEPWIGRGQESLIKSTALSLINRNEDLMSAWFKSLK